MLVAEKEAGVKRKPSALLSLVRRAETERHDAVAIDQRVISARRPGASVFIWRVLYRWRTSPSMSYQAGNGI